MKATNAEPLRVIVANIEIVLFSPGEATEGYDHFKDLVSQVFS